MRQDPHSYNNLAYQNKFESRIKEMRQILVNWMEETNHPALELMKSPYNKDLTASYMKWEEENAVKQIAEIMDLKKAKKK